MFRQICIVLLTVATFLPAAAQDIGPIGSWRAFLPYRSATNLALTDEYVYVVMDGSLMEYEIATGITTRYDKTNGLSDVNIQAVAYNQQLDMVFIAYQNANIDLLTDEAIINIPDITQQTIPGDNTIYDIHMRDTSAYLATGFGVVVVDLVKWEISDTYAIGSQGDEIRVNGVSSDGNYLYAATEEGVKRVLHTSAFPADFREWEWLDTTAGLPRMEALDITFANEKIYTVITDTLYRQLPGDTFEGFYAQDSFQIKDLSPAEDYLLVSEITLANNFPFGSRIVRFDENDVFTLDARDKIQYPLEAAIASSGRMFVADQYNGFLVVVEDGSNIWRITLNSPFSKRVKDIDILNGKLWLAPGGITQSFNYLFNYDGFSSYDIDDFWFTYIHYAYPELVQRFNFYEVAIDPNNEDHVFVGSFGYGLVEVEGGNLTVWDADNSTLAPVDTGFNSLEVGGLAFDEQGNLWVANTRAPINPISVYKTDGTWQSFEPSVTVPGNEYTDLIIDDFGQLWFALERNGSNGILVADIDLNNPGNNQYKLLTVGQGNGNLHTGFVNCLAKDEDGEVWVGTNQGITIFYCPGSMFTAQGCDAQRPLVDEGGFLGYLLESEEVQTIAVDGANRKWVGTTNGAWLLSPDGTETLEYFTAENSPLLSNQVVDIAIDHQTGEVFFGTSEGVVAYRGEATGGDEEDHGDVVVYPNPVKETYNGPIAIKGLVKNANVKITDMNGHVIFETTAFGGQAIWDGRSLNGDRAKTGVYLVFSTNEDGSSKLVSKLALIK